MATKKGSGTKYPEDISAGNFNASTLQSEIATAGARWTAAATPLSTLSLDQQKAHLGLVVSEEELRATSRAIEASEAVKALAPAFAAPPAAIDWRSNSGNWITSIKDQQSCGACVSFATLATLEARLNIACNDPDLDPDLSEAHLFYCGCGNCCPSGWNFAPALDFVKNNGVGLESSFPYTPGDQPCKAGVVPAVKITNWINVFSITERKNILATKGPMVAGMEVFQDFYSYTSGVYKHVSGVSVGYHAISVVGYDDAQQCWICKNSWNSTWGESGFFRIGYGECGIDTQFSFYDMDVTCSAYQREEPVADCSQYLPALRQVLVAAQSNNSLRRCLRYYVCGRGSRPFCSEPIMRVVRAVITILEECPEYREPFCRALR